VAALAFALWRGPALTAVAVVAVAAQIVAVDLLRGRSAVALVLCAAGLLTACELAWLSLGLRSVELVARRVLARAGARLAAVALGALAAAALVEAASRLAIGGGLGAAVLGVGATILLVALISGLVLGRGDAG